jgi:hypothetical protein
MATPASAQGAILKIGGTTIGAVTNITFSVTRGSIDISAMNTAIDSGRSYLPVGLYEPGEINFDLFWDAADAQHKAVLDNIEDAATDGSTAFVFSFPMTGGTDTIEFSGFVSSFELTATLDDAMKASVTIKLTGNATSWPTTA